MAWPVIVAAAIGLGTTIYGAIQKGRANKAARNNKRPVYTGSEALDEMEQLAQAREQQGLSDSTRQIYNQQSQRGLTSSIDAILKGGGSLNNIADVFSNYQAANERLAIMDEEIRSRNLQNLMNVKNAVAGQEDKQFQINQYAPFVDRATAAANLSAQGAQNINQGLNTISTAVSSYGSGNNFSNPNSGSGFRFQGNNSFGSNFNNAGTSGLTSEEIAAMRNRYALNNGTYGPGLLPTAQQ